MEAAEPEFQVEREGQRERRAGRRSRRYKRCSVFTGKRERDEGGRPLFDLRSRGLI